MERFGKKLRALRKQRDWSQRELADMLGFSRDHVCSLEISKRIPHCKLVIKIADIFGVSIDVLMRDELELPEADTSHDVRGDSEG